MTENKKPLLIYVVDDDQDDLKKNSAIIEKSDLHKHFEVTVKEFSSGDNVLHYMAYDIKSYDINDKKFNVESAKNLINLPDAIICDFQMNGHNGINVFEITKGKGIGFVLCSTISLEQIQRLTYRTPPFDLNDFSQNACYFSKLTKNYEEQLPKDVLKAMELAMVAKTVGGQKSDSRKK